MFKLDTLNQLEYIKDNERLKKVARYNLGSITKFESLDSLEEEVKRISKEKNISNPIVVMEKEFKEKRGIFDELPLQILSSDLLKINGPKYKESYWKQILEDAKQCKNPLLYIVEGSSYSASTV